MLVENKGVTASIHYRMAPDKPEARQQLYTRLQPLCDQYGFQLSEGQFVWEIKPPLTLTKGSAAQAVVEDCRLESALFLGDDATDVNAMIRLRQIAAEPQRNLRALSIGVIHPTTPDAIRKQCDLTADGVDDVEVLLTWLSQQRAASTNPDH